MVSTLADRQSAPLGAIRLSGQTTFEVFYEDTDLSGFVYHANYLKFFERARERLIGIEYLRDLKNHGVHFVVSKLDMKFHWPARHADVIRIESDVTATRSPVHTYTQIAYVGERKCVEARITIATLNLDHRPIRLPYEIMSYLVDRGAEVITDA